MKRIIFIWSLYLFNYSTVVFTQPPTERPNIVFILGTSDQKLTEDQRSTCILCRYNTHFRPNRWQIRRI